MKKHGLNWKKIIMDAKAQIVDINADNDKPLSLGITSNAQALNLALALQDFLVLQNYQRGTKMSWQWHGFVSSQQDKYHLVLRMAFIFKSLFKC
jgi:hypothetical protein